MASRDGGLQLPPELATALAADAEAKAMFDALKLADRDEYAQYVRDAKKPETRVRRGNKVVELMRQRDRRKAELKARGKAPITIAIDEVLNEVLAPDLKVDGFRKRGRTWTCETTSSRRIVHASGKWSNRTSAGVFHVTMGFGYPGLGLPSDRDGSLSGFTPGHFIGYQPPLEFTDAEDSHDRDRVHRELRGRWEGDYGHRFLQEADDPRYLLRRLLVDGDLMKRYQAILLGEALDDSASAREAIECYLADLRGDAHVSDPRGNPNPLGWLVRFYTLVLPHLVGLDVKLAQRDRNRARAAIEANLRDFREGGHQVAWYRRDDEVARLQDLTRFLGLDVDVASEVAHGRVAYSGPFEATPISSHPKS